MILLDSTVLHNREYKQERELLRTSQQDFFGGLLHWSTASSDFVPQGGSRNRANGLLTYISGYVKFYTGFQIPPKSLASGTSPSFLDKYLKMLMIRLFISFSQGFFQPVPSTSPASRQMGTINFAARFGPLELPS